MEGAIVQRAWRLAQPYYTAPVLDASWTSARPGWIERLAILTFGVAMLVLSQLPSLWAMHAKAVRYHPDKVFTGALHTAAEDAATYYSWIRQAREGRFLFTDLYTHEEHPRNYTNVLFWVMGNFSRVTGLGVSTVHATFRPIVGAVLLFLLYLLVVRLFDSAGARFAAYFFMVLSSGWEGVLAWLATKTEVAHVSSPQWWMPEINTYASLILFPHFLAGFVCMIGVLLLMMGAWSESMRSDASRWARAIAAGVLLAVLTFFHPYDVVSVTGVLLGAPLLFAWLRPGNLRRDLKLTAVALACFAPALAYNYWIFRHNPAMLAWDLQNVMATPELDRLLVGAGIGLPFALLSFLALRRMNRPQLVMASWFVAILVASQFPVRFQRRMLGGIQFPLAALAVAGIALVLVPWAQRRISGYCAAGGRAGLGVLLVAAAIAPLQWATPYYFREGEWQQLRAVKYPSWLERSVVDAMGFIRTLPPGEAVVLASYETGNFLPGYTGRRCVVGHYGLTIDYDRKLREVARFFAGGADDDGWRRDALRRWNVRYLIHGPHERALGGFDPSSFAGMRRLRVFGTGTESETAVYEISEAP